MELMHIKLKNGEDLIGHVEHMDNIYRITSPISIHLDPRDGFFARSWLIFSKDNSILLSKDDIFFCNLASDKAINYYEQFMHQYSEVKSSQIEEEYLKDMEEMFNSLIESKNSIKH